MMMVRDMRMLLWLVEVSTGIFQLCTYNVHEGGHGLEEMYEKFFDPHCEVAVVNEANGWRKHQEHTELARRHNFRVELLETPFGYDIGILAKTRLTFERGNATTMGGARGNHIFHHGVLHGILSDGTQTVHLLATHLSPHSAVKRRDEARALIALVQQLDREPVVVAGDLNTLSPLDDHSTELLAILQNHPRLRSKFLVTPDPDAGIDYVPMKILLADLVDVAYHSASAQSRKPHPTVPTLLHVDKLHAAPMRLDYVLLNAKAAAVLLDPLGNAIHVSTLLDDYTHRASDHYPLIVDWHHPNRKARDDLEMTNGGGAPDKSDPPRHEASSRRHSTDDILLQRHHHRGHLHTHPRGVGGSTASGDDGTTSNRRKLCDVVTNPLPTTCLTPAADPNPFPATAPLS